MLFFSQAFPVMCCLDRWTWSSSASDCSQQRCYLSLRIAPWSDTTPARVSAKDAKVAAAPTIPGPTHQARASLPNVITSLPQLSVSLSKREQQILDCLLCGLSNKCIARELNIVEATVKVYLKLLLRKIKVANRTQLAVWALRESHLFDANNTVNSSEV